MAQQQGKLPSELLKEAIGVKDDEKEEKHLEDEFFERVLNLMTSIFTMQAMAQVMTQVLTQITVSTGIVSSSIMLPIDVQGTTIMLPLDIQGSTIMLPVDIQGQVQTLDIRITGQVENVKIEIAKVTEGVTIDVIVKNARLNIYIEEIAEGVVFNVKPTGDAVFKVEAKEGYFYIQTESDVVLNIHTPFGKWVTKAEASSFSEVKESYWPISPNDRLVIHVVDDDRGVLRAIGFIIAWDNLTYSLDVYHQLQIEIYADQDPYDPEATPVWQSTSVGVDLLSGGYIVGGRVHNLLNTNAINKLAASSDKGGLTWAYVNSNGYITACGGYIYINVECMSDIYVVFKNLSSAETLRIWYAIEYGVYP